MKALEWLLTFLSYAALAVLAISANRLARYISVEYADLIAVGMLIAVFAIAIWIRKRQMVRRNVAADARARNEGA